MYEWCTDQLISLGIRLSNRAFLSRKYVSGSGLEIGALHNPLPVAEGVQVTYIDRLSAQELIDRYPRLPGEMIDRPIHVDDGFKLDTITEGSQDFVIANHVLEHSFDPLGTLANWSRVLRPSGVIFVTVPVAEHCFDKGRPITTIEHMQEDYELAKSGRDEALHQRDREHYHEWVEFSERALRREAGEKTDLPEQQRAANELNLWRNREEIHFHTFTPASFDELLACFCSKVCPKCERVTSVDLTTEVVAIVRLAH